MTALLVGGVVEQDLYGLGGESLILVYPAEEGEVTSVVAQGWAPKGASIEWYESRGATSSARVSTRPSCPALCTAR